METFACDATDCSIQDKGKLLWDYNLELLKLFSLLINLYISRLMRTFMFYLYAELHWQACFQTWTPC